MSRNKQFDTDAVLLRAMELFWYQGYEKTSVQDLVDHMGIHRKSIYDTFGDKRTLYLAVVDRYLQMIQSKMKRLIDDLSVKKIIKNLFCMVMDEDNFRQQGCLMVNSMVELSLHDEEVRSKSQDYLEKTERIFCELIQEGQRTGEISAQWDPVMLSQFLMNTMTGLRVLVKTSQDRERFENIVDMNLKILEHPM
ncbi:TetR/AcrR family transcriptional regulator [Shimazuella sp. AN120528]|uniref:TetR/AcrR family transcriptional regulator n=1 Tax=Shimazuella soli TaxID=1892854 RepID=UPI001F0E1F7B|nr:TetR/AcrR family transcriptional regulator [Shimazuella soli]MCH5585749.1 TetR/AcrR family transcriptional regulator [Shimazuella soli]